MIIGLLQLNSTIGAFAANRQKLLAAYANAVERALNSSSPRNCFCAATRHGTCCCVRILLRPICAALVETAKAVGPVPLCVGYVDQTPAGRAVR